MSNLLLVPLALGVAVCAWLIFRGLTNPERPGIVQRIKSLLKKGGGSGDDGG